MKKKKEKKELDSVQEPEPDYNNPFANARDNKTIRFFKSFDEMDEYTYRQYASYTPAESLAIVTYMRLTSYPHLNTDLNPWGNQVYFD